LTKHGNSYTITLYIFLKGFFIKKKKTSPKSDDTIFAPWGLLFGK